jgi:anti-sigma factor RsiW
MMTAAWGLGQPGDRDIFTGGNHRYAMWDAAYVLGSLSAGDRREFEMHMAHCPACRQAVVEISGIPAMLSQVDGNYIAALNGPGHASEVPAKSSELLPSLLATVRWRRRRTRLITWTVATAVAVLLTIAVVLRIQGRFPTSPPPQTPVSTLPMAQVGTTGRAMGQPPFLCGLREGSLAASSLDIGDIKFCRIPDGAMADTSR